jgi:hypothetical protein
MVCVENFQNSYEQVSLGNVSLFPIEQERPVRTVLRYEKIPYQSKLFWSDFILEWSGSYFFIPSLALIHVVKEQVNYHILISRSLDNGITWNNDGEVSQTHNPQPIAPQFAQKI